MTQALGRQSVHHFLDTGELGGGNLIAIDTARLLRPAFRESHVWTDAGPAGVLTNANGNITHSLAQAAIRSAGRIRTRFLEWKLARQLRSHAPGLAHLSSAFVHGLLCRPVCSAGLRRVVHVQIEDTVPHWAWAFREPPDAVIACARFLVPGIREALPESVRDRMPIRVIPNAIDPTRFTPGDSRVAKEQLGFRTDRPLLLMLANLAPHKGQQTTISAVALLRDGGINVECRLAGTERGGELSHTRELEKQIRDLGVADRIQLLGHRTDTPALLRAADLFLLPSTNEGLPISILEAQAAGVPVLAAPTAGVPEVVIDGETGFLIPANDAAGYADAVARLLESPQHRKRITDNAREQILRVYTWEAYGRRMLELLSEVTDSRAR